VLLIVQNRLRCGFAQFKLSAHFLETGSKRFNLLLLARYVTPVDSSRLDVSIEPSGRGYDLVLYLRNAGETKQAVLSDG